MLEVAGVMKSYGAEAIALHPVTAGAAPGETVLVLGANGSGKTTLLRVLAGLVRPSRGDVRFGGIELRALGAAYRRRLVYMGHEPALYSELTAFENLTFAAVSLGVAADVAKTLRAVGLCPTDRRPVSAYSRGMRQRVAWGRVLLSDAEIVLLDEPFTALDREASGTVSTLLSEWLASRPRIVFVALHDTQPLCDLATRELHLRGGARPS